MNFLDKFRLPTLLGLTIIILGTGVGVFLTSRQQTILSKAAPNATPTKIILSNIQPDSVVISWQTNVATIGFIRFGITTLDKTTYDDRDLEKPNLRRTHYVSLNNLSPETKYKYTIVSGASVSKEVEFSTATSSNLQNNTAPVIGSVLNNTKPLDEGIAYLEIPGLVTQSALVKDLGNFVIPIRSARTKDLKDGLVLTEGLASQIRVVSESDTEATASFDLLKIIENNTPIGPLILGQDISVAPKPTIEVFSPYDLNQDREVNAADYTILLKNFGKDPQNKKADLNADGVVDKKDSDLMSKQIPKT